MKGKHALASANFAVAIIAFGLAACLAVLQSLSIADISFPMRREDLYYLSVTAHGVLMAIVFTTFFIMGLGYLIAREALGRLAAVRTAWIGFAVATVGTTVTAATILAGKASVLYTFYPPLQAHPAFYIGATLLVVGSWVWGGVMIASYRSWRRDHPDTPVPLAVHGILTTVIIWFLATFGLAVEVVGMLIPWSLGWVEKIDPLVARTFFWWFGHPLVYFWLLPIVTGRPLRAPRLALAQVYLWTIGVAIFSLALHLAGLLGSPRRTSDITYQGNDIAAAWWGISTLRPSAGRSCS